MGADFSVGKFFIIGGKWFKCVGCTFRWFWMSGNWSRKYFWWTIIWRNDGRFFKSRKIITCCLIIYTKSHSEHKSWKYCRHAKTVPNAQATESILTKKNSNFSSSPKLLMVYLRHYFRRFFERFERKLMGSLPNCTPVQLPSYTDSYYCCCQYTLNII